MATNRAASHLICTCMPVLILNHWCWRNELCLNSLQHRVTDATGVGFCLCMCLFCFVFFLGGCIIYSPSKSL